MIVTIVYMCVLVFRFELSRSRFTWCFPPNIFQKKGGYIQHLINTNGMY